MTEVIEQGSYVQVLGNNIDVYKLIEFHPKMEHIRLRHIKTFKLRTVAKHKIKLAEPELLL